MNKFLFSLTFLAFAAKLVAALEDRDTYYYYYENNAEFIVEPGATTITTVINYGFRLTDTDCSVTNTPEYATNVKSSYINTLSNFADINLPTASVSITNIQCDTVGGGGGGSSSRKLAANVYVTQDITVNAPCDDIQLITCDRPGLERLVDSSVDTFENGNFATSLTETLGLGPVAVEAFTVTFAAVEATTEEPTDEPTDEPTEAPTSDYLCLWASGCDLSSPDKLCEPGSTCKVFQWWSQCQEDAYSSSRKLKRSSSSPSKLRGSNSKKNAKLQTPGHNSPTCYATNNGPYGGERWGCSSDGDCCNPSATCGHDRLCHLQCETAVPSPTKVPTLAPSHAPVDPPTHAPTDAPIAHPTNAPVAAAPVAAWGQCGGQQYHGSTECVAGYACVYKNPWYSQCKPAPASTPATNYKCKWATGCAGSPDSCEPGTHCKEHRWWSQCIENDVSQFNDCVATDQWGPNGSTCCNPEAVQVHGSCKLKCNN